MKHHVDSTRHAGQTESLYAELCAARQRIAELEAALAAMLSLMDYGGTIDQIQGVLTRSREALAAKGG